MIYMYILVCNLLSDPHWYSYVYTYVKVYVNVYMSTCIYIYVNINDILVYTCLQPAIRSPLVFVGVYRCECICICVYVYVYEHKKIYTTFMYTLAFNLLTDPQWYSYVYTNIHTNISIYIYISFPIHLHLFSHVTYIFTYIYIYRHTNISIYIYISFPIHLHLFSHEYV